MLKLFSHNVCSTFSKHLFICPMTIYIIQAIGPQNGYNLDRVTNFVIWRIILLSWHEAICEL